MRIQDDYPSNNRIYKNWTTGQDITFLQFQYKIVKLISRERKDHFVLEIPADSGAG